MDELSNHVLKLYLDGKITKEAAVDALSMNKKGSIKIAADPTSPKPTSFHPESFGQLVKTVGLTFALQKLFDGLGAGYDKLTSGVSTRHSDAVFQKLMSNHPALQGKDPARARANFKYIVSTSPHLLSHPMILGDNVANMTAMGSTALPTLNELAELQKNVAPPKKPNEFANQAARDIAQFAFSPEKKKEPSPMDKAKEEAANDRLKSYNKIRDSVVLPDEVESEILNSFEKSKKEQSDYETLDKRLNRLNRQFNRQP